MSFVAGKASGRVRSPRDSKSVCVVMKADAHVPPGDSDELRDGRDQRRPDIGNRANGDETLRERRIRRPGRFILQNQDETSRIVSNRGGRTRSCNFHRLIRPGRRHPLQVNENTNYTMRKFSG
jgi:hypothetical protein